MDARIVTTQVEQVIRFIRGQKVILDADLAALYGVPTKTLNRAVRRNLARFPSDFLFRLSTIESKTLRYQFGTLEKGKYVKYPPYAFTEQGVAMLSGLLNSPRAIQVNVEIMRAFVRLRGMLAAHKDLARRLDELEAKYDEQFSVVFEAIRQLMAPPVPMPKRRIGFHVGEKRGVYRVRRRENR